MDKRVYNKNIEIQKQKRKGAAKMTRLEQQIQFITEIDKVKNIYRQSYLADGQRKENDAEHSWHITLMAVLLQEYVPGTDLTKVMIMVLIHDLVEIDAGDTYAYDEEGKKTQREREEKAAGRIFGLLPRDQGEKLRKIWEEFEAWETPEAKFAHAMDNIQPTMLNAATEGKAWLEHGVRLEQILRRNEKTAEGSRELWTYAYERLISPYVEKGCIKGKGENDG